MPTTIPTTTSSTRPGSPSAGDAYFETDTKNYIIYDGANWRTYNYDGIGLSAVTNTTSVTLDGVDDYVLIPSHSSYAFGTGDFSIICWFNADIIGAATYNTVYDFRTASASPHPSFFLGTPSGFRYYYYNGSTVFNHNVTPSTGQWYMSAVVRSGTTTKVYQNAIEVSSGTDTVSYSVPTNGIRLGLHHNGTLDFDGYLDEFAIFNTALSSSQISDIYNSGNPVDLDPLEPLTWLRLGDGDTGTTVTDHGSLGNDASLVNNAAFSTTTAP